jgi:hypothetical protein
MGARSNPEPVKSVGRFVVEIAPRRFEDQRADGTRIARRTDRSLSHPIGKPLETNGFEHVSVHDHGTTRDSLDGEVSGRRHLACAGSVTLGMPGSISESC